MLNPAKVIVFSSSAACPKPQVGALQVEIGSLHVKAKANEAVVFYTADADVLHPVAVSASICTAVENRREHTHEPTSMRECNCQLHESLTRVPSPSFICAGHPSDMSDMSKAVIRSFHSTD